jgi:DNA segregation ATPase FtsK/SpoIIIE, S-DNA-T family
VTPFRRRYRAPVGERIPVRDAPYRRPRGWIVTKWIFRRVGYGCWWIARNPAYLALFVVLYGLWFLMRALGTLEANLLLGAALLSLMMWSFHGPSSFGRWVETPVKSWFRSRWAWLWRFRRNWDPAMALAGLSRNVDGVRLLPRLWRVRYVDGAYEVLVRPLLMQRLDEYEAAAEFLAGAFGAEWCEVEEAGRRRVLLRFGTAGPRELWSSGEW